MDGLVKGLEGDMPGVLEEFTHTESVVPAKCGHMRS